MDELARRRAQKSDDSTKWSPADALEDLLNDVREGKINIECLAIHYWVSEDGMREHHYSTANLTFERHYAMLGLAQKRCLDEWVDGD